MREFETAPQPSFIEHMRQETSLLVAARTNRIMEQQRILEEAGDRLVANYPFLRPMPKILPPQQS